MEIPLNIESEEIKPTSRKFDVKWTYQGLNGFELMTRNGKKVTSLQLAQSIPYGKAVYTVIELDKKDALAVGNTDKESISLQFCDVRKCWAITGIHSL